MNATTQLAALDSRKGFHEGPNNDNPFSVWQGLRNAAWCDSFAQWGAVAFGGFRWPDHCQFGYKGDAYTPYTVQHAKELDMWRPAKDAPLPGWQVLFDWNNTGAADHIGTIVKDRGDGTFITIEGNYHDQVAYVVRDRKYMLGFVALVTQPSQEKPVVKVNAAPVAILTHPSWPAGAYTIVCADGGVDNFGGSPFEGSEGGTHLNAPIVTAAVTPSGQGYILMAHDGGVFCHGDAVYEGRVEYAGG